MKAKIKNLLQQTILNDLDIVILNCQNLEDERSIYKKYLSHPNFREILIDNYCTLYHAWNLGINSTLADCVINTNADDMLRPDACERYLSELEGHDVAFSYYAISNKPNRWDWDGKSPPNLIQPTSWERLFLGPGPAIRRSILAKTGLYDPDLFAVGDCDLWGRLRTVGAKARLIKEPLILYYHNHASLERRRDKKGKSLIWLDGQTRKQKKASQWTMDTTSPTYPTLSDS